MIPPPLRRLLRNQSIKRKLTAIVVVTSGVAVVLASAAFLAYDYNSFRERMVTDLATTADGVGLLAYPALDAETADGARGGVGTQARDSLAFIMGSLRAYPSIDQSVVFDANGRAVGGQERNILLKRTTPAFVNANTHAFTDEGLVVYRRVTTPEGPPGRRGLSALEHQRAREPARALRRDPGGGHAALAAGLAAARLAAAEADLAARSSTWRRSRRASRARRTTRCAR